MPTLIGGVQEDIREIFISMDKIQINSLGVLTILPNRVSITMILRRVAPVMARLPRVVQMVK